MPKDIDSAAQKTLEKAQKSFVQNTIQASTSAVHVYLTDRKPQFPTENRLTYYLHSPLDMSITTQEGIVSGTTNTIRGATYRRCGEVQYVSLKEWWFIAGAHTEWTIGGVIYS